MIKTKSRVDHCRCYCMNSDILCELWQSADVRLCLIESFTFIHQHSPTRWVKGKGQIMLGFHWYQKQNAAVFLAMICSFHTLRCQVPYNLPEFPVPVSDSGTNVRYRPVTCWCFGFLHHQICTSATHVGIQLFPNTGRSYLQFCAQLTLQEACWLFGGLKSSVQHCWTVESCGTMLYQHEHRGSHDRKGLPGVAATDAGTVGVGCSSRRMRDSSFFVIFKDDKGYGFNIGCPKIVGPLLSIKLLNSMSMHVQPLQAGLEFWSTPSLSWMVVQPLEPKWLPEMGFLRIKNRGPP